VDAVSSAEFVLPCSDLEPTVAWLEDIGFRLLMITPADAPSIAVLEGHGATIRLDASLPEGPAALRLPATDGWAPAELTAPNGTAVEFVAAEPALIVPDNAPEFVVSRVIDADVGSGRAGMQYRDLVPNRHGGRYVASHITIPIGGPVADYVHHHRIRFQMIFCHAGWADLVYEDQGPPFRFEAGDCVLQPPHIRHQVLATSDRFEAVEIGSPAVHDTLRDHELGLPTTTWTPTRDFDGQRFVWHQAKSATTSSWRHEGFEVTDFGIGAATVGLANVGLVTASTAVTIELTSTDEFMLWFLRSGHASLCRNGETHEIRPRDSVTLAPGESYKVEVDTAVEFLEVRIPG